MEAAIADLRDLIVREGDYGSSAFLIIQGSMRVTLESLPPETLGRKRRQRKGIFARGIDGLDAREAGGGVGAHTRVRARESAGG